MATKYSLVVGNPGVGKSTLLNGVVGKIVFKSGLSFDSGYTKFLQEFETNPGIVWIDTPGLKDSKIRLQSGQEIEKAMKKGGLYRLLFVVTLEEGRVRPDDAATLLVILAAIPEEVQFSIILNKLSPEVPYHTIISTIQCSNSFLGISRTPGEAQRGHRCKCLARWHQSNDHVYPSHPERRRSCWTKQHHAPS